MGRHQHTIILFIWLLLGCQPKKDHIQESLAAYEYIPSSVASIQKAENNLTALIPMKKQTNWNIVDRMRHYQIPGVSIAIIHNHKLLTTTSYGFANANGKQALTAKTLFAAGSLSKFVTALALVKLTQQQHIDLETPISQYLKSWKDLPSYPQAKSITLKQLLSHTAGINLKDFAGYTPDETLPNLNQMLAGIQPSTSPKISIDNPDSSGLFKYSSGGYLLIQKVLEDAMQQDFENIVRNQVFAPLQLTQSTFQQPVPVQFGVSAKGHTLGNKESTVIYPQLAAKGLWATPHDLATMVLELQKALKGNSKIYSKAQAQRLITPLSTNVTPGYSKYNPNFWLSDYGLGLATIRRKEKPKAQYFTHGGDAQGFKARIIGHIEKGYGAVVMVNSDQSDEFIEELLRSIALTFKWESYLPYHTVQEKTTISLYGFYNASNVSIAGSFNYWKANQLSLKKNSGQWDITLPLPKGKYMYKFIVDGHWLLDPDNPLTEVYNNTENSLIEVE